MQLTLLRGLEIVAILITDVMPSITSINQCGAAKRQADGPPVATIPQPTSICVCGRCADGLHPMRRS